MSQYFPTDDDCARFTIFPGVHIRTCAAEKMMMSYVEIEPNAVVERHSHPHEQIGMVLEGRAHFFIGEDNRVLGKGDQYRIPGGVPHRVVGMEEGAKAFDIFYPIREDYR